MVLDRRADHRIRFKAVRALGHMKDPRSEEVLLKALDDKYPIVRLEAISALAEVGGGQSRAALEKMLNSKSACLRASAAKAFIKLSGVPDARRDNLELLFSLLSSNDVRIACAIMQIGAPALAFLLKKIRDFSLPDSNHAAWTLAQSIRMALDFLPPGSNLFSLGTGFREITHNVTAQEISNLYRFKLSRRGIHVNQVINTGFDRISRILCGDKEILFALKINLMEFHEKSLNKLNINDLLDEHGAGQLKLMGRTLIAPINNGFLALKLCINHDDLKNLFLEAQLQEHLRGMSLSSTLPRPLGDGVFLIEDLPSFLSNGLSPGDPCCAIGYIAVPDYFTYINDPDLSFEDMMKGISNSARDLAHLTREGLIHTSLIPLFHKKIDEQFGGIAYCWHRKIAGRLERWLESCRYPNLRLSGIADFEHICLFNQISPERLQIHIGEHLFSMSLVLSSYFRHKASFDQKSMKSIIRSCFEDYYRTLTGMPSELDEIIDWDMLVQRMIEEMKLDGCPDDDEADPGGQHLGILRGPFPLPELIRAIHIISVLSVIEMQSGTSTSENHHAHINCSPQLSPPHNIF